MAITGVLNVGFIGSSFVAAVLWFMSAAMPRLPKRMTVGFADTGGMQDDLLKTLVMQSGLNKLAAVAAGTAATFQVISALVAPSV